LITSINSTNFDASGHSSLTFLMAPGKRGSICHTISFYQDDQIFGKTTGNSHTNPEKPDNKNKEKTYNYATKLPDWPFEDELLHTDKNEPSSKGECFTVASAYHENGDGAELVANAEGFVWLRFPDESSQPANNMEAAPASGVTPVRPPWRYEYLGYSNNPLACVDINIAPNGDLLLIMNLRKLPLKMNGFRHRK